MTIRESMMKRGEGNSRDRGARGFLEHIKKVNEAIAILPSYDEGKEEDCTSGSEGMDVR